MNFIYITTNNLNGKRYVGSHEGEIDDSYLGSGKFLLRTIKKYGRENFQRQILEICDKEKNLLLEEKYINELNTLQPNGYNISPKGGHQSNHSISESTKEKMSISKIGKKRKPFSEDHKRKIGEGNKGKIVKHSEEAKRKMSESHKGLHHNKETKEKISKSCKGKSGRSLTKEEKEHLKTVMKGTRRRVGKKHSEETKLKMREAHRKRLGDLSS